MINKIKSQMQGMKTGWKQKLVLLFPFPQKCVCTCENIMTKKIRMAREVTRAEVFPDGRKSFGGALSFVPSLTKSLFVPSLTSRMDKRGFKIVPFI